MKEGLLPSKHLGKVGLVGRFKPLHNGAALMLDAVCRNADEVLIGIGSSNKYNLRNPFTAEETKEMIHAYLDHRFANYDLLFIPDFAQLPGNEDGQTWRQYVVETYGQLDAFVTANSYVANLLHNDYKIVHPASLIPPAQWMQLRATEVRVAMAQGKQWKHLVPTAIATSLESYGLIDRFRREFGSATLTQLATMGYTGPETEDQEKLHTRER